MKTVAVDLRMARHSGIGVYISRLLPRVIRRLPECRFHLLGGNGLVRPFLEAAPERTVFIPCDSPIYSLREQVELAARIPPDADLFWSPHYNIPLLRRGRLLVTVHDLFHLAMPGLVGGPHKSLYARTLFSRVKAKADAVICVSRFTAEELKRLVGVDPARIRVIHNGVDPAPAALSSTTSPEANPYLLFVGNVKPNKNLSTLLRAFDRIRGNIPHTLVVVGKTEEFGTGDPGALALGKTLGGRVRFTGVVEDELLWRYYRHADAFVFPSLYEGFGFPPLEAMAAGCPVLASNAPSIPEICSNAAIYFDPLGPEEIGGKILEILSNGMLKSDLVRKGTERVRSFSWDRCAEMTCALIREIETI